MKILVTSAMPYELKVIRESIKNANLKNRLNIDYLCCGLGNYQNISSLECYLIQNPKPTFILSVGFCGCCGDVKNMGIIQIARVVNIHTLREMVIPPYLQLAPMKLCFSGENFDNEESLFMKNSMFVDEIYFDMESRGVEFIASKFKLPHLILKIPFSFVSFENFLSFLNDVENQGKMSDLLSKLPYNIYLQKILDWMKLQECI